jgi:hypothetical protein
MLEMFFLHLPAKYGVILMNMFLEDFYKTNRHRHGRDRMAVGFRAHDKKPSHLTVLVNLSIFGEKNKSQFVVLLLTYNLYCIQYFPNVSYIYIFPST